MLNKTEWKKVLIEKGLSQNSLAKLMNIAPPTLSYKVNHESFTYQELVFLKNLFGDNNFMKIFFKK